MRLLDAADRLTRITLMALKSGDEAAARRLLSDKGKVVDASRQASIRADILDSLGQKLGQAISLKEANLIRAVASSSSRAASEATNSSTISSYSSSSPSVRVASLTAFSQPR
eukprot:TRINITY_DN1618_c0_g1_i1.p1 TRINITY_DN1618_c0_g1~~TRINITY_DN1618_c0_g1_i1.p1  ORF type:complete len:112 (-),score=28.77 TRINITY_DN1618_c0_g1_i1:296-631(-)